MKTIKISMVESYTTTLFRESITLNVEDYPELEGLSDKALESYINDNAYDMVSTNDNYDSLGEQLREQDVTREKTTGEDSEVLFD